MPLVKIKFEVGWGSQVYALSQQAKPVAWAAQRDGQLANRSATVKESWDQMFALQQKRALLFGLGPKGLATASAAKSLLPCGGEALFDYRWVKASEDERKRATNLGLAHPIPLRIAEVYRAQTGHKPRFGTPQWKPPWRLRP